MGTKYHEQIEDRLSDQWPQSEFLLSCSRVQANFSCPGWGISLQTGSKRAYSSITKKLCNLQSCIHISQIFYISAHISIYYIYIYLSWGKRFEVTRRCEGRLFKTMTGCPSIGCWQTRSKNKVTEKHWNGGGPQPCLAHHIMYIINYVIMYVCMYVCMFMYVCMYVCMHACMHACM